MQKYSILRILVKIQLIIFLRLSNFTSEGWMEYGKYLVMISHLEGASNGCQPNQVVPPHSSGSTPMFCPTVTKRDPC